MRRNYTTAFRSHRLTAEMGRDRLPTQVPHARQTVDRHPSQITNLLQRWREGSREALDALLPLVYDELRRVPHHHLKNERPDHLCQITGNQSGRLAWILNPSRNH